LPNFVLNLSGYVTAISDAMERGDAAKAARVTHDLKGSAGGYGYPQISELAQQLESALKTGCETTQLTLLVEQIATTCQQALLGLDP
jgi:HPt (histidine-containing phosphotransfer) domain-containing protein